MCTFSAYVCIIIIIILYVAYMFPPCIVLSISSSLEYNNESFFSLDLSQSHNHIYIYRERERERERATLFI